MYWINFKTSYVTVNLKYAITVSIALFYFKTSYVTVNPVLVVRSINKALRFQNILCYG